MELHTQYLQNPDGSKTAFRVRKIAAKPSPMVAETDAPAALVAPAPVPVVEVAHVQTRPIAAAEPVAEAPEAPAAE